MTLPIVFETKKLEGVEGKPYKVGPYCCNPICTHIAEHAHHMVRRTALGKPYDWIKLPDGKIRGNLVGVCPACHDDLTGPIGGHKASIRYADGIFYWCRINGFGFSPDPVAPIEPQPPTPEAASASSAETESESEPCPTCGQTRRRPSSTSAPLEGRRRTSWTMDVPDDHEDGAEILDALADDLALKLGYTNERSRLRRYHSVYHALVFTQQNVKLFMQSLAGRG